MPGWAPLPTGEGATPLLKMLRAMDAQISGTITANAGSLVDLTINGALTIGIGGSFSATDSQNRFVRIDADFSNWATIEFGDNDETYDNHASIGYLIDSILDLNSSYDTTGADSGRTSVRLQGGGDPLFQASVTKNHTSQTAPAVVLVSWDTIASQLTQLYIQHDYMILQESGGNTQFRLPSGTATIPSLAWPDASLNYDTGFFRYAADQIGVSIAADKYVTFKLPGENQGAGSPNDGALWVDTLPLELDSGTGAIIAGQSWRWDVGSNLVHLEMQALRDSTGTDHTTAAVGIRRITDVTSQSSLWWRANQIIVNASGSNYGDTLAVNGTFEYKPGTTGSAASAYFSGGAAGWWQLLRSTSARRYKRNISYDWQDYLADMSLEPAYFYRPDDDRHYFDFIAEDLAEQDGLFGVFNDDGVIENYHKPAVAAILASKVNRLEAQVKELQRGIH